MTQIQKNLWDLLPEGEWLDRDETHKKYGKWQFQGALSFLHSKGLIELQFIGDKQFIRRKAFAEIIDNKSIIKAVNNKNRRKNVF